MTPSSLTEPHSVATRGAVAIVRQILVDGDAEGGYLTAAQQMCANAPTVMLLLASMYADAAHELAELAGEPVDDVLDRSVQRFVEAEKSVYTNVES